MIDITIPLPPYFSCSPDFTDLVLQNVECWKKISSKPVEKDGKKRIFHTIDFYPDSSKYQPPICPENNRCIILTDKQYKELEDSSSTNERNITITSEWDVLDKDLLNSDFLEKWLRRT